MLYLALSTVVRFRREPIVSSRASPRARGSPFLMGLSIGLTNPYQLGWWIAIGAGMVAEFGGDIAVGFFAGIVGWTLIFTTLVYKGVTRYERLARPIAYASAILMAGFGLWFLAAGISGVFL